MTDKSSQTRLEKLQTISNIAAAIAIPIILGIATSRSNVALKERESQTKFVELAVNILLAEPLKDESGKQTNENQQLRNWAIGVVEEYSGVKIPEEAKQGLKTGQLPVKSNQPNSSIDYSNLENFLQQKKYPEADSETRRIMYKLSGLNGGYIDTSAMSRISCDDIKYIDNIWTTNTNNMFGFTVQREIYTQLGSVEQFGDAVGWRKNQDWLTVEELKKDNTPKRGSYPTRSPVGENRRLSGGWLVWHLLPNNSRSSCLE